MENLINTVEEINIRNVYFSDLHHILRIHKDSHTGIDTNDIQNKMKLNGTFGLPMALAVCDKQIIGYASVSLNFEGSPEIHVSFKKGFEKDETKRWLTRYAQRVFNAMHESPEKDYSRLDAYIKRLVDWLD